MVPVQNPGVKLEPDLSLLFLKPVGTLEPELHRRAPAPLLLFEARKGHELSLLWPWPLLHRCWQMVRVWNSAHASLPSWGTYCVRQTSCENCLRRRTVLQEFVFFPCLISSSILPPARTEFRLLVRSPFLEKALFFWLLRHRCSTRW